MGRNDRVLLLLIVVANVLLRLPWLGHSSFDLDEAVHVWNAQKPLPDIIARAAGDPNPPLFNILISFWIGLFGVDEAAVRWFSLLFSGAAAGALFVFMRRHFTLRAALLAVLFFTLSSIQLKFAHNARPYSLMVFLMVCSYGMLLEALKRPRPLLLAGYGICTALMLYAHPTSVFNLPAQGLFILWGARSGLRPALLAAGAMVAGFGGYLLWYLSIPYFEGEQGTWLAPPTLADAMQTVRLLNGSWSDRLFYGQLAIVAVGLGFILRARDRPGMDALLLGVLWTAVPFWGSFLFSHAAEPIFQAKYVLSAQVGMTVLLAVALDAVRWHALRWAMVGVLAFKYADAMNWKVTTGEDWRAAAAIVREDGSPRTATFISPWYEFQAFAYHYDRDLYRDHANTQPGLAAQRVFITWGDILPAGSDRPRYGRVHFVEAQGDQAGQGPRIDSLRQHATLVAEHRLEGINLYTFDLNVPPPVMQLTFDRPEVLEGEREYSPLVLFPLDASFPTDTTLRIMAEVLPGSGTEGVFLVVSVVREGNPLTYAQIPLSGNAGADGWHTVETTVRYERAVHGAADIKAYVWNPSRRPVQVRRIAVEPLRP